VATQVDDVEHDLTDGHGVAVVHQAVWRHRQVWRVDRMRDGLRSGGAGDRTESLLVIAVPVGGDNRVQLGPVGTVA
jgi:hypothetical protein